MAKEHLASLTITPIQKYGSDLRYNEYAASIGTPANQMYQAQHVYWRDYSHGLSLVNPNPTVTYTVTLPGGSHYVDLNGKAVTQTVTLPPHSGLVLLIVTTPHGYKPGASGMTQVCRPTPFVRFMHRSETSSQQLLYRMTP